MYLAAQRLSSFIIGHTSVNPSVQAPIQENLDVCASRQEAVPAGATVNFKCERYARYVIVAIATDKLAHFSLCEVQVYGNSSGMYAKIVMIFPNV